MLTGDDGQGNPTATTTNNNKVLDNIFQDNGDGLEPTRGAAFNLIANNHFVSTKANPEPSQGIEILWGNDNAVSVISLKTTRMAYRLIGVSVTILPTTK